jgi:serine protease Do
MRVFYPGDSEPYRVEHLISSERADLALLKMNEKHVPELVVLSFATTVPRPGDEILVVGYPLGIRGILARVGGGFIERASRDDADFWELVDRLAQDGYIRPLASRGIVSQVSADYVVYDAETTTGGSGGPVLDSSGSVVAVNTAIVGEFGGSNLGVLSSFALQLIDRYREDQ